jgi:uncharacterized integral membrane protein
MSANYPPAGSPQNPPPRRSSGDRLADALARPRVVLGGLITIAAVWFIIANNTTVRIRLWVVWVSAQLWVVLLLTFVAGALVGLLSVRHRRKSRRR